MCDVSNLVHGWWSLLSVDTTVCPGCPPSPDPLRSHVTPSTLTCGEGPVLLGEHTYPTRVRKVDIPDPMSPCLCCLISHLGDIEPKFLVWGGAMGACPLTLPTQGTTWGPPDTPWLRTVSREGPKVAQGGTLGQLPGSKGQRGTFSEL